MPPQEKSFASNVPILIVVFVLLCAVSIWMYSAGLFGSRVQAPVGETQTAPKEVTTVNSTDLAQKSDRDQLPAGFPSDIPVDTTNKLSQSYVLAFPDRGVNQYTVEFNTKLSAQAQYKTYLDFMTANGYTFGESGKNANASLYGTKNNDDLSVVFSSQNGVTTVSISYLDRQ